MGYRDRNPEVKINKASVLTFCRGLLYSASELKEKINRRK